MIFSKSVRSILRSRKCNVFKLFGRKNVYLRSELKTNTYAEKKNRNSFVKLEKHSQPQSFDNQRYKAKSGKTKSLSTVLNNKKHYHVNHAIKLGSYNIGREGFLLTLPLYMCFLLNFENDKIIGEDLPIEDINSLWE